jgi:hypothetical protein
MIMFTAPASNSTASPTRLPWEPRKPRVTMTESIDYLLFSLIISYLSCGDLTHNNNRMVQSLEQSITRAEHHQSRASPEQSITRAEHHQSRASPEQSITRGQHSISLIFAFIFLEWACWRMTSPAWGSCVPSSSSPWGSSSAWHCARGDAPTVAPPSGRRTNL